MNNSSSRLFDSFSQRLFDHSTLFPTVAIKFLCNIYKDITYIVPFNTIDQICIIQLAKSKHIQIFN
jgi:hypothetical protein